MADKPGQEHTIAEALVALAAQDGLGDPIDWQDVKAAVELLLDDPFGSRRMRSVLQQLNDQEVRVTLRDWLLRAAAERELDAKKAARAGEKVLAPIQIVSLGGTATSAIGITAGTLSAGIGLPVLGCALLVAFASSVGRWRLSKREDQAQFDRGAIERLRDLLATGKPERD